MMIIVWAFFPEVSHHSCSCTLHFTFLASVVCRNYATAGCQKYYLRNYKFSGSHDSIAPILTDVEDF
jgi:hypothetical protein